MVWNMLVGFTMLGVAVSAGTSPAPPTEGLSVRIDDVADRRWIGRDWQACRLQDWRIADGELVNEDSRLPIRTAHALVVRLAPDDPSEPIHLSTTIRPVGKGPLGASSFAGLLIGVGHEGIDPRLSALVQQVPAPDGGMLAVVDGAGAPRVLDFSTPREGGFRWSLPRDVGMDDLVEMPDQRRGSETSVFKRTGSVTVRLSIQPRDGRFDLRLAVADGDVVLSETLVTGVDRSHVDGGIALVGHRDRRVRGVGWGFGGIDVESKVLEEWVDEDDLGWGPVLAAPYTLDRTDDGVHSLAMNVLFAPIAPDDLEEVALELRTRDGSWRPVDGGALDGDSASMRFEIPDVEEYLDRSYRITGRCNGVEFEHRGRLHAAPENRPLRVASLNCVKNITAHSAWNRAGVWYPHEDLVDRVASTRPDLYFFAGDQIYEGDVSGPDRQQLLLDYHTKYQRWLRSFGELVRDRPCVIIPDDHDVYHGNIWGAGGVRAVARDDLTAQDAGGYRLSAREVNAIHRTQVGNLPKRMVEGPIGQGIEPYTTRLRYGPADFAILADRMWKDSPSVMVPEAKIRNGWIRAPDVDPVDADAVDASFLGESQELFLEAWARQRDDRSPRKIVLSQTPWVNVATLPPGKDGRVIPSLEIYGPDEYAPDDEPVADGDSGGWPQTARNRAVALLQEADALHLCGDQHLGSLVQYGIDRHRDGPYAFTPPAVANTWPRRWMPSEPGRNREPDAPRYTGDFRDGWGNLMTIHAVTNPQDRGVFPRRLHDLSPGFGIVEVAPMTGAIRLEAWPRWLDPIDDSHQYAGFPFVID